jgi:hypothetical protein
MALYVIPSLGDFLSDIICDVIVGAEMLDSLPAPPRSLTATMPWNPESGVGKHEKRVARALHALPLLFIMYSCKEMMIPLIARMLPSLSGAGEIREFALGNGEVASLCTRFFGIKSVNKFIATYVAAFTPSIGGLDPASRMQMISFLGDLIPI